MKAVRCRGLGFAHRGGPDVLRDLDLAVEEQDLVALVGPNGCGKSTLIKCLAGVWKPTAGSIEVWGDDLRRMGARSRARTVAYLPQASSPRMPISALDTVILGRHPHTGGRPTQQDERLAGEILEELGLIHVADQAVNTLSGGQLQLVMLARCLVQDPKVILLDEPTSAMDLRHVLLTMDCLRRRRDRGLTIVAALHDLSLAARVADQIIVLDDGSVNASGTSEDVLTPAMLAAVYGVSAKVDSVAGHTIVLPERIVTEP